MNLQDTIACLCQDFPHCFSATAPKPLVKGIHHRLNDFYRHNQVLMPSEIKAAMRYYVRQPAYLAQLTTGQARIKLDGTPSGELVDEQEAIAAQNRRREPKQLSVTETLALLKQVFPLCFIKGKAKRPISLTIEAELLPLIAQEPKINPKIVQHVIRLYCTGKVYQSKLVVGAERVNLDGQVVGIVTANELAASS